VGADHGTRTGAVHYGDGGLALLRITVAIGLGGSRSGRRGPGGQARHVGRALTHRDRRVRAHAPL